MNKPCRKHLRIAVAVLIFLPVFFSCSNHAEGKSLSAALDQIDVLINQNQYKDAAKELSKIENKAFSSWQEIGIFRRYNRIEMKDKAEKILLKALKKNPENEELNAVYTNFLMKNGRIGEALSFGKVLQGTKYGSIYSEVVFRDTLQKSNKEDLKSIFRSSEYFPVYYDAYTGSKKSFWLRNCALLRLSSGSYENAASIHPGDTIESDDAYFWALVMYDAQHYPSCYSYAEKAFRYLGAVSGRAKRLVSHTKLSAILQDSLTWMGDGEQAEQIRAEYFESISDNAGDLVLPEDKESLDLLPVLLVNSSKWSRDNQDDRRCVDLLSICVENWPDYVPALTSYGEFAYKSNIQRKEDYTQLQLRDEGLATLEMERYDNRVRIPVSDALYRIDQSLERYKDPLLFIVRLDLKYKTDKTLNDADKIADMWRVLEKNAVSPSVYPSLLLEYAMNFFIERKMQEDAWKLFYKYISAKYDIPCDENFWTNVNKKIYGFTSGEAEYAFYFATAGLRVDDSLRLGEFCVFESGVQGESQFISPLCGDKTCMNLAMVYGSLGMNDKALDLYGKINGRCSENNLKSVVMYRMALIYYSKNDLKSAKRCAEYAVTLNNHNADAKMLLVQIKNM